jgi:hypothetical protein
MSIGSIGANLMDSTGLFGASTTQSSTEIPEWQRDYLKQFIQREGELWPGMLQQMETAVGGADDVYAAAMSELNRRYPEIAKNMFQSETGEASRLYQPTSTAYDAASAGTKQVYDPAQRDISTDRSRLRGLYGETDKQLSEFSLDPAAQQFLENLRSDRVGSLKNYADELVGKSVSGLADTGMLSSTTAEGAFGDITDALAPAISSANADYWNARIALPGQVSGQRFAQGSSAIGHDINAATGQYNMGGDYYQNVLNNQLGKYTLGTDYGKRMADAYGNQYSLAQNYGATNAAAMNQMYQQPLQNYYQLWNTTANMPTMNAGSTTNTSQNTPIGNQLIGPAAQGGAMYLLGASSRDFKDGISVVTEDDDRRNLELVKRTEVVTYRYKPELAEVFKDDGKEHIGIIAEDAPSQMTTRDRRAAHLYDMIGTLMSAVKELARQVEDLKEGRA